MLIAWCEIGQHWNISANISNVYRVLLSCNDSVYRVKSFLILNNADEFRLIHLTPIERIQKLLFIIN